VLGIVGDGWEIQLFRRVLSAGGSILSTRESCSDLDYYCQLGSSGLLFSVILSNAGTYVADFCKQFILCSFMLSFTKN
jgi:hypothetical protein